jgi:hypothetical protein
MHKVRSRARDACKAPERVCFTTAQNGEVLKIGSRDVHWSDIGLNSEDKQPVTSVKSCSLRMHARSDCQQRSTAL